jgi:hypothetical protein
MARGVTEYWSKGSVGIAPLCPYPTSAPVGLLNSVSNKTEDQDDDEYSLPDEALSSGARQVGDGAKSGERSAWSARLLQIERNTLKRAPRTTGSTYILINFVELYSFSTGVHSGPV